MLRKVITPVRSTLLRQQVFKTVRFSTATVRLAEERDVADQVADAVRIQPIPRPNESTETKRARLLYQSRKRGILESDLLLSKFAKIYLPTLNREQLEEYDDLLNEQDWDIYYWATNAEGTNPCPERWEKSPIMDMVRTIAKNEKREIMRMPDLE